MPVFIQENHLNRIITIPAPRGVAQRCGIPCASSWPFVRVVAGTMLGGGGISWLALRPHSGSLGVLG